MLAKAGDRVLGLNRKPKCIAIDLDGTLVDSVPDLAYCVDQTMLQIGRDPHGENQVRQWVGNGVDRLVKRALTGQLHAEPEDADFAKAREIFMALYKDNVSQRSCLYPGVEEALVRFKDQGYLLACVTNKAAAFTEPLLADLKVDHFFSVIVSGDTVAKKKPDPEALLYAAEHLGCRPSDGLMVGDSEHDVAAARAAGFQIACVPYGYNHGNDIREAQPDVVIQRIDELIPILQELP